MSDTFLTRIEGPSPVAQVARDIVKRGVWVAPVMMGIGAAIWSVEGFFSVGYGIVLILANFAISAAIVAYTSRVSLALMMGGVLFGFLIRLGVILAAVWLVKDADWIHLVALGLTIIVTHLGLLFWELRYVSLSMAHPGLKPGVGGQTADAVPVTAVGPTADAGRSTDLNTATNKEHSQP